MPDVNEIVTGEETLPEETPKEYLVSPKPSVKLACGNCGSKKIFKRTDLKMELEIAQCEHCARLFAICPICKLPSGLETQEMEDFQRFWRCPNCDINFTLQGSSNTYRDMWEVKPPTQNYPYGNPEVTYDTKGGVPMDGLEDTLNQVPVGYLTPGNEPNIEPVVEEDKPKRGRKRVVKQEEVEE